jgi:hypothetical protein
MGSRVCAYRARPSCQKIGSWPTVHADAAARAAFWIVERDASVFSESAEAGMPAVSWFRTGSIKMPSPLPSGESPMPQRQFVLIVTDRDSGEFTVEGPMMDDRPWNTAVVDAQRIGRNIRCFGMGDLAPDVAAVEWRLSHGGRRIASGAIVCASHRL